MTYKVIATAEAGREWNEAADRYEGRDSGVGSRFDDELQAFLRTLAQDPERFQLATKLARKAKMPKPWPYSVYYAVSMELQTVIILAIWHGARNPIRLYQRLK